VSPSPRNTLVIFCHPNPQSYSAHLRDSAIAGLETGHHPVRVRDLYAEGFDPVLSASERMAHFNDPSTKPEISAHADDLLWCTSLVLVYPTWWAGQPAMLKGWIDRVWIQGVAWELPEGATRLKPLLSNIRKITVVTTHGSSKMINALEGEGGKRVAFRSLRVICHPRCRTRWIALYNLDRATDQQRREFAAKVTRKLAK
jgi:NAD(P)H dehydrogenase (quinone)